MAAVPLAACYRHPDRLTRISCVRCGKSICHECMVAAPVGFQCPDCVAGASTRQSVPRTVAGSNPIRAAYVTWTIVGLCVLVFVVELLAGTQLIAGKFGLSPLAVAAGEIWRLLTSAFLHAGILHLGFNMLVLIMIGPALESILGHLRYLTLYLLSALGGATLSYLLSAPTSLSVGASGAIFGLMAGLVVAGRRLSFDIGQVLMLIGINLVISFVPGGGIDWRAHVGGLVVGAVAAAVLTHAPNRYRNLVQSLGCLLIFAILATVVFWRTDELRSVTTQVDVSAIAAGVPASADDR